jgi:hypothetical protein
VSSLDRDLLGVIRSAFPDGVVESVPDPEECFLAEILGETRNRLSRVEGTRLLYERPPCPEPRWSEGTDSDEDPPEFTEFASSYHLFFVARSGRQFELEIETETPDEDDILQVVGGRLQVGYCVAVSLIAPLAIIRTSEMESYEDGTEALPDIEETRFRMDGSPLPSEVYLSELLGQREIDELKELRGRIETVLRSLGIAVLSDEEARRPLPWLRTGEGTIRVGMGGGPFDREEVRVLDALFFREP